MWTPDNIIWIIAVTVIGAVAVIRYYFEEKRRHTKKVIEMASNGEDKHV